VRVAFASGKGGTGKTLLSTSLAAWLSLDGARAPGGRGAPDGPFTYVDADVEEPNGHLFLHPEEVTEERFCVATPVVRADRCTRCGACQRACAFHACLVLPADVLILPELCHACGVCALVCPTDAIEERPRATGTLRRGRTGPLDVLWGTLDVGEARATPLVDGVLAAAPEGGTVIVDCPPGTSCTAMAALEGADLVVLVTEPTPFGLHDLDLAVQLCRALGRPVAAVLNRADIATDPGPDGGPDGGPGGGPDESGAGAADEVERYLAAADVPLLAAIPFDPAVARAYAEGRPAHTESPPLRAALRAIRDHLFDSGGPAPAAADRSGREVA
jgi:MinD superfamily P-loop ATPase